MEPEEAAREYLATLAVIERLRRIAEDATPGRWESLFIGGPLTNDLYLFGPEAKTVGSIGVIGHLMQPVVSGRKGDAEFVGTFGPRVIGAMLDVIAAAHDGTAEDRRTALDRLMEEVRVR